MPITSIGSYPPTMQNFVTSWNSVNASLSIFPTRNLRALR